MDGRVEGRDPVGGQRDGDAVPGVVPEDPVLRHGLAPAVPVLVGAAHGHAAPVVPPPLRVVVIPVEGDGLTVIAEGEVDVPLPALYGEVPQGLGQPAGLPGSKVQGEGGPVLVQPLGLLDIEGQILVFREVAALQLDGLPAAVGDAGPVIAVPRPVQGVALQTAELRRVVRVGLQGEIHPGEVDGQLVQVEALAVQRNPLPHLHRPAGAQEGRVDGQGKGELRQHRGPGRALCIRPGEGGVRGLRRACKPALVPAGVGDLQHQLKLLRQVRPVEVEGRQTPVLLRLAGVLPGGPPGASRGFPVFVQEVRGDVQPGVPRPGEGVEHVQGGLVHDEGFHRGGDAVLGLGLAHGLDVVVFKGGLEAGPEGHRLGQLPDEGDPPAGHGEGGGAVHQHREGRRRAPQGGQGDAQPLSTALPPGPGPGPVHRPRQLRGGLLELGRQSPVFLGSVH